MKKLFAALAICVSTAAFANENTAPKQDVAAEKQEKKGLNKLDTGLEATDLRTQKPGDAAKQAQKDAAGATNEKTVTEKAKDVLGMDEKDKANKSVQEAATFKTAQAFNLNGTVKSASGGGLTLERPGLPAVDLDVRDQTVVMLNGKRVEMNAIPEGAQVRAKFQLDGDDIVAVRIDAKSSGVKKSSPATGGAGAAGREMKHDAKAGMKEAGQDVKAGMNEAADDTRDAVQDTQNKLD